MQMILVLAAVVSLATDRPKGTPDFHVWTENEVPFEQGSDVQFSNGVLSYHLYVDPHPLRHGIYAFSQFRFCPTGAACEPETLHWIRHNPAKRPTPFDAVFFHRLRHRTWRTLWLKRSWYWRQLPEKSTDRMSAEIAFYRVLMAAKHAREGDDPLSLKF